MQDGMYLGAPPVNIGLSAANATLRSMLRGASLYGGAAGGPPPLATPQIQMGLPREPANPQRNPQIVALYSLTPAAFKQHLRQRFGG